jgi:hypothetical protein
MRLEIGCPKAGWLPVSLSIADQWFEFQASNVANDPLTELVMAAVWCLDDDSQLPSLALHLNRPYTEPDLRGVHFWSERAWHSLLTVKADVPNKVGLRFYENHHGGPSLDQIDFRTSTTAVFESLSAAEFAGNVYSSVSETLQFHAEKFGSKWRTPFPHGLLRDLSTMVRYL